MMGRADLPNHFSWARKDNEGRVRNLKDLLDDQMKLEVIRGRQNIDSVCWVQSDECYVCERWGYYVCFVTKADIDDCHGFSGTGKLTQLTPMQERTFDKVATKASLKLEDLDLRVPYLIGALTNGEFIKMTDFTDYMLSIDPEAEKVKWNSQGRLTKVFSHYHDKWDQVLQSASH